MHVKMIVVKLIRFQGANDSNVIRLFGIICCENIFYWPLHDVANGGMVWIHQITVPWKSSWCFLLVALEIAKALRSVLPSVPANPIFKTCDCHFSFLKLFENNLEFKYGIWSKLAVCQEWNGTGERIPHVVAQWSELGYSGLQKRVPA